MGSDTALACPGATLQAMALRKMSTKHSRTIRAGADDGAHAAWKARLARAQAEEWRRAIAESRLHAEPRDQSITMMQWLERAIGGAFRRSLRLVAPCRWERARARRMLDAGMASRPFRPDSRALWVDVTALASHDHGGGIQHVVRGVLSELLFEAPDGFQVIPVRLSSDGTYYRAARFEARFTGRCDEVAIDAPIDVRAGDVFLGLDLIRDFAALAEGALRAMRRLGARMHFVVYDLLPAEHPEWFPAGVPESFSRWLDLLIELADAVHGISNGVAERFARMARQHGRVPAVNRFPMGYDILDSMPPTAHGNDVPQGVRLLMVGTLEPRKRYDQALDAFDRLLAQGENVRLCIVGRLGWHCDELARRIQQHPRFGEALHWIDAASDLDLQQYYRDADALLMCSEAEGFGLPIIEAAAFGKPLILRDIAEFREVAGAGAWYFAAGSADELTQSLRRWLQAYRSGAHPASEGVASPTWRESARSLSRSILAAAA